MHTGGDIQKRREDTQSDILKSFDFNPLKIELESLKVELLEEQSVFGSNNSQELEDVNRILNLIENNKIQINGKFRIEKTSTSEGIGRSKICWQSVRSIGKTVATYAGECQSRTADVLQDFIVKSIAEKQALLISDAEKKKWGEVMDDSGQEALVYNDPDDDTKVLKNVKYFMQNKSLPDFIERTIGFNAMFPDTAYDIIGFRVENKRLNLVLRQPRVYGEILRGLPNRQDEHKKALQQFQNLGYDVDFEKEKICKNGYIASDLSYGNIMKTPSGQYRIIDAFVEKLKI